MIFQDIKYHLSSSLQNDRQLQLSHSLDSHGATRTTIDDATHIITNSHRFEGWKDVGADVVVVTEKWVDRSIATVKLQNPQFYSADPAMIFSGVVACATELPVPDLEVLSAGITALGGQWRTGLTQDVTHLFAITPDSNKYSTAMHFQEHTNVKVILPHWFDDAVRLGLGSLNLAPYEWPDPPLLKGPGKEDGVAEDAAKKLQRLDSEKRALYKTILLTPEAAVPDLKVKPVWDGRRVLLSPSLELIGGRREAVEVGIKRAKGVIVAFETNNADGDEAEELEKVGECDVLVTRYRSGKAYAKAVREGKTIGTLSWVFHVQSTGVLSRPLDQLLHYPIPKNPIEGFSAHEITVTNYTGESREYLKKLIAAMGATFTPSMSGKNTVLIAAFISGTKTTKATSWSIPIVNHTWLEDCFVKWRNLTVGLEKYIIFPPGIDFAKVLGERGLGRGVELEIEGDTSEDTKTAADADTDVEGDKAPMGTENSARDMREVEDVVGGDLFDGDGDAVMGGEPDVTEAMDVDEPVQSKLKSKAKPTSTPKPAKAKPVSRKGKEKEIPHESPVVVRPSSRKKANPKQVSDEAEEEAEAEPVVTRSNKLVRRAGLASKFFDVEAADDGPRELTTSQKLAARLVADSGRSPVGGSKPKADVIELSDEEMESEMETTMQAKAKAKARTSLNGKTKTSPAKKSSKGKAKEVFEESEDEVVVPRKGTKANATKSKAQRVASDGEDASEMEVTSRKPAQAKGKAKASLAKKSDKGKTKEVSEGDEVVVPRKGAKASKAKPVVSEADDASEEEDNARKLAQVKRKGKTKASPAKNGDKGEAEELSDDEKEVPRKSTRAGKAKPAVSEGEDASEVEVTTKPSPVKSAKGKKKTTTPQEEDLPDEVVVTARKRISPIKYGGKGKQMRAAARNARHSEDESEVEVVPKKTATVEKSSPVKLGKGKGKDIVLSIDGDESEAEVPRKANKEKAAPRKSNTKMAVSDTENEEEPPKVVAKAPALAKSKPRADDSSPVRPATKSTSTPKRVMSVLMPPLTLTKKSSSKDVVSTPASRPPARTGSLRAVAGERANVSANARPSTSASAVVPRSNAQSKKAPPTSPLSSPHTVVSAQDVRMSTKRNAATKATQKLRDEIMPDLMNYQQEMRNQKSRKSVGAPSDYVSVSVGKKKRLSDENEEVEENGERENKKRKISIRGDSRKGMTVAEGSEDEDEVALPPKLAAKKSKSTKAQEVESDGDATPPPLNESKKKSGAKATKTSDVVELQSSAGSKVSRNATKSIKLMTTQVSLSDDVLKVLTKLGVKVTSRPAECTHLLVPHLVRTEKFLCALAVAPYILTDKWAIDCATAKKLLPEEDYILHDKANEKKYNFKLAEALERAKKLNGRLFAKKTFYVTGKVSVDIKLLKNVVSACGGVVSTAPPSMRLMNASPDRHIISCIEDISIWRSISEVYPIYTQELILLGALKQEIEWDNEAFKIQGVNN